MTPYHTKIACNDEPPDGDYVDHYETPLECYNDVYSYFSTMGYCVDEITIDGTNVTVKMRTFEKLIDDIYAQLTPEDIEYASDPDRTLYMGFAALHDRMDANLLLPVRPINPFLSEDEENPLTDIWIRLANRVMNAVSRRICNITD